MNNEPSINRCPKCGADVPAEAPQGLCPKCVLLGAATSTEASESERKRIEPPPLATVAAAFPQLEIIELIGHGGMGLVYKGRQPRLDRFVALKLLPEVAGKDPAFAERFNREARVLARLNHPNIVTVFDFGQAGGFFYLLMEFVDGVNLRQAMRAGKFSPAEALNIVPKICDALQFAHSEGILHRDIKPENILLDARGRVKIADFGIAKLVGDTASDITLTASGAALGTPHYMAPEQLEKPQTVDHRADIYSLGVVFYEMLTGELPIGRFAAPSAKTTLDDRVDEIVLRALAKERELRQQSAGQMKTEVETVASQPKNPPPMLSSATAGSVHPDQKEPGARPTPPWMRRVGILFLALGGFAFLPTLFSFGTNVKVYHSGMLLALTGIALLTRNKIWRSVALGANWLGLLLPIFSMFVVAQSANKGVLPPGWTFGVPGWPNSGGLAVLLWLAETAVFAAAIRALTRPDAKAAFGLNANCDHTTAHAISNNPPRRSKLAVGAAVLLAFSLIAAIPLLFLASFAALRSNDQAVNGGAPALMVILFVLLPGVLGTILGAIATWRMNRNANMRGLGLALFAALAWPVLLFNTLASRIIMKLIAPTTENPVELWTAVIFVSLALLALDAICLATIWRKARQRGNNLNPSARRAPGFAKLATLTALLLALPVFALNVLSLALAKHNLALAEQPQHRFASQRIPFPAGAAANWQMTPTANPVSDSEPALVLRIADVDVFGQFVLVTLVSEAGWPAHALHVNFDGPTLDISPELAPAMNTADCVLEPRRSNLSGIDAATNGLLSGRKFFKGPTKLKLAFALPDEGLAQFVSAQCHQTLLGKPAALKTPRTLSLFSLQRDVGFNDRGEPQQEILQASVSVFAESSVPSNNSITSTATGEPAAEQNPPPLANVNVTTRKQDIQIRLARENLAEQRKRFEVGAISPLDLAKTERDLAVVEARGDALKIAEAKLTFAEMNFASARKQFENGKLTSADLRSAEAERDIAKIELEEAQAKAK